MKAKNAYQDEDKREAIIDIKIMDLLTRNVFIDKSKLTFSFYRAREKTFTFKQ